MNEPRLRVAVIGYGYWGPNLVRNLTANQGTQVVVVADRDERRRRLAQQNYPWVETVADAEAALTHAQVEGVVIATPLFTHHELARAALEAGKHVLVEKPLASSVAECEELIALAEARGLTLMVDHTFVYTGPVRKMREFLDAEKLGRILYLDSVRINLGLFQPDFNVIWDLAPHDLSIFDYVLGRDVRWVSAVGANHFGKHENLAYLTIGYDEGVLGHVHCSWVAPVKTRYMIVAGTQRMLVYDDTRPSERIKLYESGVDVEQIDRETAYELNVQYRTGDVLAPKIDGTEALRRMVGEFERGCRTGQPTLTDGRAGLRVVRVLEAAQESLDNQGKRVTL